MYIKALTGFTAQTIGTVKIHIHLLKPNKIKHKILTFPFLPPLGENG